MRRTTIFVDDELLNEIKELSKEENKSIAEIIRLSLRGYINRKKSRKTRLSFIGIGNSGKKNVAENHEDLLWKITAKQTLS